MKTAILFQEPLHAEQLRRLRTTFAEHHQKHIPATIGSTPATDLSTPPPPRPQLSPIALLVLLNLAAFATLLFLLNA